MTSFTFMFPLPPAELKTNRRMGQYWGNLHRLKASYRTACDMVLLHRGTQAKRVTVDSCHIVATAYLGKGQRCDPSDLGAWVKSPIDALVTGGWLASDSAAVVKSFTAIVERDAANPRLEIEVRENGDEDTDTEAGKHR